jgi:hypothetical protein
MGGFGFPSLSLQLPHDTVRRVNIDGSGLMLTIYLGKQRAIIMRVVSIEEYGDSERDNIPSHF